ncbi:C40 family peptidase [Rothia uropygialis]|uniref:C40 family peptidase n=1 Tax=Kocuria sp. 36 TaxID=1415402 RepID=UPI00101D85CE|nr:C40 family peptidase [Kocuria sp. 36]
MRFHRIIAAAGALGLACSLAGSPAMAESDGASAQDALPGEGISVGDTAFVDTTVATLWGEPGKDRPIDKPSTTNPVDLDQWNKNMEDTETRGWLTGNTETQAVYGSEVSVTEIQGDWSKVVVHDQSTPKNEQGYPGWVPTRQLIENNTFDHQKDARQRAVVTSKKSTLTNDSGNADENLELSFNTELPVVQQTGSGVQVSLPDGGTGWVRPDDVAIYSPGDGPSRPTGSEVVETGKQFLGLRYLWAGVSAYGYDCSGFTYSMYRAHGIDIPRDADAQAEFGQDVAESDLQPGDLLFFAQPGGTGAVHHVGMYMGDGKMIHAPNESTTVSITDWKQWDSKSEFSGAKRML